MGRKNPRTGGVIIAYKMSREEAEALALNDPFNINGVARFTVTEVALTFCAKGFEGLVD